MALKDENEQLQAELEQQRAENAKLAKQLEDAKAKAKDSPKGGKAEINPEAVAAAVAAARSFTVAERQPIDLKALGYEGRYRNVKEGSKDEVYGLKVEPVGDVIHGRTHKAQSQEHFWEGNEEDFRKTFEKV